MFLCCLFFQKLWHHIIHPTPENIFLLIGLLAGAIFFIDGWGPTEKQESGGKKDFFGSRKFRGLSVIVSGSIISPLVDLLSKNHRFEYFIHYLKGVFWGWFGAFSFFFLLFILWKYWNKDKRKREKIKIDNSYTTLRNWVAEFLYTIMDFIYLGVSENPYLRAKREHEIKIADKYYAHELKDYEEKLGGLSVSQARIEAGEVSVLSDEEAKKVKDYLKNLKISGRKENEYSSDDWYYRGIEKFQNKNYKNCIEFMYNALEKNPNNLNARIYVGMSFLFMKFYTEAIGEFDKIIVLSPTNAYAFNNRGYTKKENEDFQGAIDDYTKAIALKPLYFDAYNNRAYALFRIDKFKEGIEDLNKAELIDQNDPLLYYNRGLAKHKLNYQNEAIEDYNLAIEKNPDYHSAYCNRGVVKYELKNYKGATEDYSKAIDLNPNYVIAYNNRGTVYFHAKNYSAAIADYSNAIALDNNYSPAYNNRGEAKYFIHDYEGVLSDCSKAIDLKPNDSEPYYYRGLSIIELSKKDSTLYKKDEGCNDLRKASELGYKDADKAIAENCG